MARKKAQASEKEKPAKEKPAKKEKPATSVVDQLLDDLSRAPEDWKLRGVVADWYEDNDRSEEAAALRWMIKNKKRPYHGSASSATWFNLDTVSAGLGDPESDIPGAVFKHLEGGKAVANHMTFPSLREAEEAFLAGWVKARKQGWKGKE
jgi:hypothetical protein